MSEENEPKGDTFTKEYVEKLRNESAGHRLKAQETQMKLDALSGDHTALKAKFDTADAARVTAESTALEAKQSADARIIGAELKAAARDAGLIDADDLRLVDLSALKLSDKGEIDGLTALVDSLKTGKPHLFKAPTAPLEPNAGPAPGSNTTPITPPSPKDPGAKHARDMAPEEYAAERARLVAVR